MLPNDAILVDGRLVCPVCRKPVSEPYRAGDQIVRRHLERLDNGEICSHGHGQGDPLPAGNAD